MTKKTLNLSTMGHAVALALSLCLSCSSIQAFAFPNKPLTGRQRTSRLSFPPSKALRPAGAPPSTTALAMTPSALSILGSALTRTQNTLHGDPSFVLTSVLLLSVFGISLERHSVIGKALSAPLATMALALTVANLGMVPFASPMYTMINKFLVPLAVPMLLFDSDLKRVMSDTGSLLLCFGLGALATIVGTLVAFPLIPLSGLGSDVGWRVACALAARHIGGAINFVAVAETLGIPGAAVSAAIAADNVVVALYFAFLFYISVPGEGAPKTDDPLVVTGSVDAIGESALDVSDPEDVTNETSGISLSSLGMALTVSSLLVTLGRIMTRALLPSGTSALPLMSVLTVAAATSFPKFFQSIRSAGTAVGILFIQMFFAASGAAGNLGLVLRSAPSLFAFSALQISIHFGTLVLLGRRILKLEPRELYLASNANVGGPTTAAAMAQAKEWNQLVLPALLVGILGYATATGIALALGPILRTMVPL